MILGALGRQRHFRIGPLVAAETQAPSRLEPVFRGVPCEGGRGLTIGEVFRVV